MYPIVLDSEGLSRFAKRESGKQTDFVRALVQRRWRDGGDVVVPAIVCAEVCRGHHRTAEVEALLARHPIGTKRANPILVVDTDYEFARLVGTVLEASGAGSKDIVDAHVVAVCIRAGGGLVITCDPDDIHRLAAPFPAVRVLTRTP
jgi:predicted nucleic acid-binding protein